MKKHTKIYFIHFDLSGFEFIACECCGSKAVDIHHIDPKGMGGSKTKDYIENLIALCRVCHVKAHANIINKDQLRLMHLKRMNNIEC